jgi:sugar lactone lactonase YvrE
VHLAQFDLDRYPRPAVRIGGLPARIVFVSERALGILVPENVPGPRAEVLVEGVDGGTELHVGQPVASELHQVDNPVFDTAGNLYVTDSGTRGQRVPVSVFRVRPDGTREPFVSGIVNATSMTMGPDGLLYVSSRFEGKVYRVDREGRAVAIGTDLGITCGLAFGADGGLFVGDRSGTIFRLDPASGAARVHASLPASVAAFHLAGGDADHLYVTAPTLASHDDVYRVDADGTVSVVCSALGRPQGLAYRHGHLYVVDAAAGWNGVYRVGAGGKIEAIVAGTNLIGLAFDPAGGFVVASNDTVYRFGKGLRL